VILLVAVWLGAATPLPETFTVASVTVNEILMDTQRSNERVITWRQVPVSWTVTAKEGFRTCIVLKRPKVGDRVACDWIELAWRQIVGPLFAEACK
jgi:hypothetical protein